MNDAIRLALFRRFVVLHVIILFKHISLVVGQEYGSERQCDDESDEPEQTAPYGERKQYHCGVEACHLAHDAWCEHPVLYGLHHAEDDDGRQYDGPEACARVVRLEYGKYDGRDEAHHLQVRHEVEHADEESERYGKRKVDDEESDGE